MRRILSREAQYQVEGWLRHLAAVVRAEYQHSKRTDNRDNNARSSGHGGSGRGGYDDDRPSREWGLAQYRLRVQQIQDDRDIARLELDRKVGPSTTTCLLSPPW